MTWPCTKVSGQHPDHQQAQREDAGCGVLSRRKPVDTGGVAMGHVTNSTTLPTANINPCVPFRTPADPQVLQSGNWLALLSIPDEKLMHLHSVTFNSESTALSEERIKTNGQIQAW